MKHSNSTQLYIRESTNTNLLTLNNDKLTPVKGFPTSNSPAVDTVMSEDGQYAIILSPDEKILTYVALLPQVQTVFTLHLDIVVHSAFLSPCGLFLVIKCLTGFNGDNLLVYRILKDNQDQKNALVHSERVNDLDPNYIDVIFCQNDEYMVIKNGNRLGILKWDKNQFKEIRNETIENLHSVKSQSYRNNAYVCVLACKSQARETDKGYCWVYQASDNFKHEIIKYNYDSTSAMTCKFDKRSPRILLLITNTSNKKTYYGLSQLIYIDILTLKSFKVKTAPGNVHAFEWVCTNATKVAVQELKHDIKKLANNKTLNDVDANGKSNFVVISGAMPAYLVVYDENANIKFDLCRLHRNTLALSPNQRYMVVGGFGNLSCEYELYDMQFLKVLCKGRVRDTTHVRVSNHGLIAFMSCYPRMHVDNFLQLNDCLGNTILRINYKRLWSATFRYVDVPYKAFVYTDAILDQLNSNKNEEEKPVSSISSLLIKSKPKTSAEKFSEIRASKESNWEQVTQVEQIDWAEKKPFVQAQPKSKVVGLDKDNSKSKVIPPDVQKKISILEKKLNDIKGLKLKIEQGYFLNKNQQEKVSKQEAFEQELKEYQDQYK